MNKRFLSPIISGLIYPGAGQLLNGHHLKGWTIITITSLNLVFLIFFIFKGFITVIKNISAPFGSMWEFIAASLAMNGRHELVLLIVLFALWIYAIVDAHIGAPPEKSTV
ncbi:MAG: hypothetical protein JW885_06840 [Deltaproteobacteria bacterium]|nr:hypothetical protein [Candidatus Zymogenaceae bacterium]